MILYNYIIIILFCCVPAGLPYEHCLLVYRYFFPTMLAVLLLTVLVTVVVRQVNSLYENVRNEKYAITMWL